MGKAKMAIVLDYPTTSLGRAFALAFKIRWRGLRSQERTASMLGCWMRFFAGAGIGSLDDISTETLLDFIDERTEAGDSPATMRMRLSVLHGVVSEAINARPPLATRGLPSIRKPRVPREEKWWLTPERRAEIVPILRHQLNDPLVADYVEFICETGLRVEEALRVQRRHFLGLDTDRPNLVVIGTKTAGSQKPIPISSVAAALARSRLREAPPEARLFPITYSALRQRWLSYRKPLGLEEGAVLKALRRSFAGQMRKNRVPTETLMRLMRHQRIHTTAAYLELVGSDDLEDARQYLS